jgi:uncharacterized protein (TIGR02284 family)
MTTIETLNLLLKTCRDGQAGFRSCAAAVDDGELQALLGQRADDCARAAEELKALVAQHGGRADDDTSLPGDLHRGWVIAKGALTGRSERAILAECERGEDVALRDYRLALEQDLPPDVRQAIERQLQGVQRNHDQIKALRDARIGTAEAARGMPGFGRREPMRAQAGTTDRMVQWSLAQVRLHPVRSLGVVALIGLVGWRAVAPRSSGVASWLRRLR